MCYYSVRSSIVKNRFWKIFKKLHLMLWLFYMRSLLFHTPIVKAYRRECTMCCLSIRLHEKLKVDLRSCIYSLQGPMLHPLHFAYAFVRISTQMLQCLCCSSITSCIGHRPDWCLRKFPQTLWPSGSRCNAVTKSHTTLILVDFFDQHLADLILVYFTTGRRKLNGNVQRMSYIFPFFQVRFSF